MRRAGPHERPSIEFYRENRAQSAPWAKAPMVQAGCPQDKDGRQPRLRLPPRDRLVSGLFQTCAVQNQLCGLDQLRPVVHAPLLQEAVGLFLRHAMPVHEQVLGLLDDRLLLGGPAERDKPLQPVPHPQEHPHSGGQILSGDRRGQTENIVVLDQVQPALGGSTSMEQVRGRSSARSSADWSPSL